MSLLTYGNGSNTVTLPYGFNTQFRQEAVRDDLSNTDWVMTKFDISLQCVINTDYLGMLAPDLVGNMNLTGAADVMQTIRSRLLKPRQQLSFTFNGRELIPQQTAGAGTVDVANGPIPQMCSYTLLTNNTFLMQYHIIAHYWENNRAGTMPVVNQAGNPVLWNRWTETVEMDNLQQSRRTREGKFVIRSDNAQGVIADLVRDQMAVLGVPLGFVRESSQYVQDPSGLAIMYRIVDKEVYKLPPSPAKEAAGEYIESTTHLGAQRWGEAWVRLKGDNITSQTKLIERAVAVVSSKLIINGAQLTATGAAFAQLQLGVIKVNMYENEVECRMRCRMEPRTTKGGQGRTYGVWGFRWTGMAKTPFSDNTKHVGSSYYSRGTANLLLQAAAYFDPSLSMNQIDAEAGQMQQGLPVGTAGTNLETGGGIRVTPPGDDASVDGPSFPAPDQDRPYLNTISATVPVSDTQAKWVQLSTDIDVFSDYQIENHYERDGHIYMMPVASPGGLPIVSPSAGGNTPNSTITSVTGGATAAFVQLATPTVLWVADWTVAKWQLQPEIPNPDSKDANWILLDVILGARNVTVGPDGTTPLYRLNGIYVYGCLNPSVLPTDDVAYPRPPWLEDSFPTGRSQPPEYLTDNLLTFDGQ